MKEELYKKQNSIVELDNLVDYALENIFNVYKDGDYHAYNILKTVRIPADLDPSTFTYVRIDGKITWTQISQLEYGTIRLWWLICVANGILNPVLLPKPGLIIKVIKPEFIQGILQSIKSNIADSR